ncbi:MAG: DUF6328 family protein [Actinomycetota bacterium]|nr:DUF6328 family protein [Actinomycetota bacterium]
MQVLFAFLLIVPFSQRYGQITELQKQIYFIAVLCTAIATVLFIAPSPMHRIEFRAHDKEWMLAASNRLAIGGFAFLALAMVAVLFLITDVLFAGWVVALVSGSGTGLFAVLWFGLPLYRRMRS